MGASSEPTASFDLLSRLIDGHVLVPESPTDERLPKPFNARFDAAVPRAVVTCTRAGDVAEAISFARRHRMDVATRSSGHCFAGRASSAGILIDVSPMNSVSLSDGLARVGGGAGLGEVYAGLLAHDLTIPGGSSPSVGVAGLTLGGGLGFLGRSLGRPPTDLPVPASTSAAVASSSATSTTTRSCSGPFAVLAPATSAW